MPTAMPQPDGDMSVDEPPTSNRLLTAYCSIGSEIEESKCTRIGRSPDRMPLRPSIASSIRPSSFYKTAYGALVKEQTVGSGLVPKVSLPGVRPAAFDSYTSNPEELVAHCLSSSLSPREFWPASQLTRAAAFQILDADPVKQSQTSGHRQVAYE